MEHRLRTFMLAAVASLVLTGGALGQTSSDEPNANGVANQFQSGAHHVGSGFVQLGDGIKQGAILTWHAIVDGVSTTASHFGGNEKTAQPASQSQ